MFATPFLAFILLTIFQNIEISTSIAIASRSGKAEQQYEKRLAKGTYFEIGSWKYALPVLSFPRIALIFHGICNCSNLSRIVSWWE